MLKLPKVFLPTDYLALLTRNINTSVDPIGAVNTYISSNDSFRFFIQDKFKEFGQDRGVEAVLKSLGWTNFRNNLSALYLGHLKTGVYSLKEAPVLIKDLVEFENKIQKFCIDGYSRGYLLAFYLKMARVHLQKEDPNGEKFDDYSECDIPTDVLKLLDLTQTKVIAIDWLILGLSHFYSFLGGDLLQNFLTEKSFDFKKLYNYLDDKQKYRLTENLLNYAMGINEIDMFVKLTV